MKEKELALKPIIGLYIKGKLQFIISILFCSIILSSSVSAHRGSPTEIDTCRIPVGGEVIHFTAYTPQSSAGTGYCQVIPDVGATHLVFDYEGHKLRNTTVEFEITKEPEGTRIFYQQPEKVKRGTMDAKIDFSQYGAGNYLAHITIVYEGEKQDSHLPFSVGLAEVGGGIPYFVIILVSILFIALGIMVMMSRSKKNQANSVAE